MANTKNITLDQLQLALVRVKQYNERTYSELGHSHTTEDVMKLTGFTISNEGDAVDMRVALSDTDTLNEALGKLDKSVFNIVNNINSMDFTNHDHNNLYYQKTEIDKLMEELETSDESTLSAAQLYTDNEITKLIDNAPDALDTLKELADALNNDDDFAGTITNMITDIDNKTVDGPDYAINNNVAIFNGSSGKLIQDSGYTIASSVPDGAIFTDYKVQTSPSTSSIIYFAGTSNQNGETDGLLMNSKFYISGLAEKIVAPNFEGRLIGKADTSGLADKAMETQASLSIKLNGNALTPFNGKVDVDIDITPSSIGAHDVLYTEKATDSDVLNMLNNLFGEE